MAYQHTSFSEKDLTEMALFIEKGGTIGMLRGLGDSDMEGLYSIGCSLYDHGKYGKAKDVFEFLCQHEHLKKRNWMGLGAACQMHEKYDAAVKAYAIAVMLDYKDPWPHLHAGECYLTISNMDDACSALHSALYYAGKNKTHGGLKTRAKNLLRKAELIK